MSPKKVASPLSRKATLVAVEFSQWTARKLDKKVTDKVNREHGAADDAGRYNKLLIEAKRLEDINSVVSRARRLHYTLTKPWSEGIGILPNVLHEQFATEFRKLKREFDVAVAEFCAGYEGFVRERKRALNGLFNQADYPSPKEIRSKFKLTTKTFPVPDAGDFRSDVLDQDTLDDIKRELVEHNEGVLDGAMQHTFRQIAEVVGHMSEKLKAYKNGQEKENGKKERSFFSYSLVENVRELADLLDAFNLTNDPALAKVIKRIKKELCVEEADTLRNDDKVRESVQKSADDILKDVESLIG